MTLGPLVECLYNLLPEKLLLLFEVLSRMVLRDKVPHVLPSSCGGKMSCMFLVIVPMAGVLTLAGLWLYRSQQIWEMANRREAHIQQTVLQIGRVIMDFNIERELTTIYVTSRTEESQTSIKAQLDLARLRSDLSVSDMYDWPGTPQEGHMFTSRLLFSAVLDRHRSQVKVTNYFTDEMQFYTNLIDIMFGWLHRHSASRGEKDDMWRWLLTYSYLMGTINYAGAEQTLCSVFHSIVCFSHRETLYYANFSFGNEAVFRLYRQSYPDSREEGWRTREHGAFFPELHQCRKEIYADLDYIAMSLDPSLCEYSSKNETQFHETDILMEDEHDRIIEALYGRIQASVNRTAFEFLISGVVLGGIICYITILHIIRCTCIKCVQMRKTRKWRLKEMEAVSMTEDKMDSDHMGLNTDHMTLQAPPTTNIYRYEDYNCKPNAIKVATV